MVDLSPESWITIFRDTSPSKSTSLKSFHSAVGCSPEIVHYLWVVYFTDSDFLPTHLLYMLSFLYVYGSNWVMATLWGTKEDAFQAIVMQVLIYFSEVIDEVRWENRLKGREFLKGGYFENTFVAIDTTECPVASRKKVLYSGYKKKYTFKYEAAVSLYSREFVWAPTPAVYGPVADQTAFRTYHMDEIMENNEKYIGDGHYVSLSKSLFFTKTQFTNNKKKYGKVRAIVEHAFQRLKTFNCMSQPWRHNIATHQYAYKVCLHITNVKFREKPLHKNPHWLLFEQIK